ncbi:unnamed protein product [Lampetra planeri]
MPGGCLYDSDSLSVLQQRHLPFTVCGNIAAKEDERVGHDVRPLHSLLYRVEADSGTLTATPAIDCL